MESQLETLKGMAYHFGSAAEQMKKVLESYLIEHRERIGTTCECPICQAAREAMSLIGSAGGQRE